MQTSGLPPHINFNGALKTKITDPFSGYHSDKMCLPCIFLSHAAPLFPLFFADDSMAKNNWTFFSPLTPSFGLLPEVCSFQRVSLQRRGQGEISPASTGFL